MLHILCIHCPHSLRTCLQGSPDSVSIGRWPVGGARQQILPHCPGGHFGSRLHAEFHKDVLEVCLDGARCDKQFIGSLAIGQSTRDQAGDLPFASGKY